MKIEIIICTEAGYLEAQSKLLVYSIRTFGGILADADIYSYKPRKGNISDSTIDFFKKYDVNYVDIELNSEFPKYPLANKPLVCAHRESISDADILIFLDGDTFFMNSPDFIKDMKQGELFMRPVDKINVGSDKLFLNENGYYWKELYQRFGIKKENHKTIFTSVDNTEILEYYNSGMIISSNNDGLFQNWASNFKKIMDLNLMPSKGLFFVEQSVLSATISAMNLQVQFIPKEFNCPLHLLKECQNKDFNVEDISRVGHVHYHKKLVNPRGINPYYNDLNKFERGKIINQKIVEFDVLRKENYRAMAKRKLTGLKEKLKSMKPKG